MKNKKITRDNPLFRTALEARKNSYSPYSGKKVGAAILTSDGRIFGGCNVENSSFGGTVCAERNAIHHAVAEGAQKLKEVLVITDASPPWPPCGLCRQVIAEFATSQTRVHLCNVRGEIETLPFSELMPRAFSPKHLKKSKK